MITITVTTHNAKPLAQPFSADFDAAGGTIGRGSENTLVLLDPDRKISRTHATVICRDGAYALRDQGSVTPVVLNGQPIGNGRESPLRSGDEIRIGGYLLQVAGDAAAAEAPPATEAPAVAAAALSEPVVSWESDAPAAPGEGITTVILPSPAGTGMASGSALDAPAERAATPEAAPAPAATAPPATAPAAAAPAVVAPPAVAPLAGAPAVVAPPAAAPPAAAPPAAAPPAAAPAAAAPPAPAPSVPIAPAPVSAAAPLSPPSPPVQAGAAAVTTPALPAAPATSEELLRALLAGAGLRDVDVPGGLTPELMEKLGQLLSEATRGLLDLLAARASTKRDVRADMTVIVAADNNPLKFSPNLEAALTHLLVPRGRGFMPPLRALADAYEDLRTHQLGFMAGMRSALAVVLARFNPHELEQRLAERSMVDSFLPGSRKAKLWDHFTHLYGEIAVEAESDFHKLFGQEFLKAYRAHAAKPPSAAGPPAVH